MSSTQWLHTITNAEKTSLNLSKRKGSKKGSANLPKVVMIYEGGRKIGPRNRVIKGTK